jgi:hypothetical protein
MGKSSVGSAPLSSSSALSMLKDDDQNSQKSPSATLLRIIQQTREEWDQKTEMEKHPPMKLEWSEEEENKNIEWEDETGMMNKMESEEDQLLKTYNELKRGQEKLKVIDFIRWSEIQDMFSVGALSRESRAFAIQEMGIENDKQIEFARLSFDEVSFTFGALFSHRIVIFVL